MAFPYLFESNFEIGDTTEWTTGDTDSVSQLDVAHYSDLARFPDSSMAPFAGAYALRAQLTGGSADAFAEVDEVDISLAATRYVAFNFLLSKDFDATVDDIFNICELVSTSNAVENAVSLQVIAATDVVTIGIGQTAASAFSSLEIERGKWYCVELVTIPATSSAGVLDLYVTKHGDVAAASVAVSQITGMTNLAVTEGRLGIMNHATTTTGTILYDRFIFDDTGRVYPQTERYPEEVLITKSAHIFIGSGKMTKISLLSGAGTDNVLTIYDTDIADTNDASNIIVELKNTVNNEMVESYVDTSRTKNGCYVALSGTNPRALIVIENASSYGSDAVVRLRGSSRATV